MSTYGISHRYITYSKILLPQKQEIALSKEINEQEIVSEEIGEQQNTPILFLFKFSIESLIVRKDGGVFDKWTYEHYVRFDTWTNKDTNKKKVVEAMLLQAKIPDDTRLVRNILDRARYLEHDESYKKEKFLPISINVKLFDYTVPAASKETIENPNIIKANDDSRCSVCLENLLFGSNSEVISFPCWHIFHGGCITKWMEKSDSCPMCRSELVNIV
ncbi:hypothetical protein ACFE04_010620 [Oxalis oulophora]